MLILGWVHVTIVSGYKRVVIMEMLLKANIVVLSIICLWNPYNKNYEPAVATSVPS